MHPGGPPGPPFHLKGEEAPVFAGGAASASPHTPSPRLPERTAGGTGAAGPLRHPRGGHPAMLPPRPPFCDPCSRREIGEAPCAPAPARPLRRPRSGRYGGNMETRPAPCKGAGRGVYYHLARRTGVRESAEDLENRILRIQDGFNEKNKLASNQFEFFSGTPDPRPGCPPRSNGEFDPGSG